MNRVTALIPAIFLMSFCSAQISETVTLEECQTLARDYYPMAKQKDLINQSQEYSLENAKKGYLPQINFAAQATYQNEVTQVTLPPSIPVKITPPSKDQYKMYGEVNQGLTDAFVIEPQRKLIANNSEIEQQKLAVELYKLKERINQLYFGVLMIDGQMQQVELLKKDIQTGIDRVTAAINNGVAYKSNRSELQAELLKAGQRSIELSATRRAYLDMLGQFINRVLGEKAVLQTPEVGVISTGINRPELLLFESQKKSFGLQGKLVVAKTLPKASLFFQGGYAKPGLNMLKNEFAGYYFTGLRLGWSLSGFYTFRHDKKLLELNQSLVDVQRETFLFNTNFALKQQNGELQKLQELIKTDDEIIDLRIEVKNAAKAQLENGVITTSDFLIKVNAEDQARQNRLVHRIQLLMTQYNYKTTAGN